MALTPSLEAVLDALQVGAMGGDLDRLSLVCLHEAEQHEGEARERLIAAGEALAWGAKLLAAMEAGAGAMPGTNSIA